MEAESDVAEFAETFLERTHASIFWYLNSLFIDLNTFFALDFRTSLIWIQY